MGFRGDLGVLIGSQVNNTEIQREFWRRVKAIEMHFRGFKRASLSGELQEDFKGFQRHVRFREIPGSFLGILESHWLSAELQRVL